MPNEIHAPPPPPPTEVRTPRSSRSSRWAVYAAVAALAVLAVRALVVPLFVWDMLRYPFDYFFNEGDTLFYTLRLIRGEPVYSNSSGYPLLGNIYPPVYLWITSFCSKLAAPSLASDRAFAVIPLLLTMIFAGLFLKRAKAALPVTLGATLLIPCCYSMSHYLVMPRCDSWMACFCVMSFYFLSALEPSPRDLALGALFAALAVFTKQTALFGLALVQLTLIVKAPRKGFMALAFTALFCALLLTVSLWQFGPIMIEAITSLTVRRQFDASRFMPYYMRTLTSLGVVAALAYGRASIHTTRWRWDFVDSYVIGHSIQTGFMLFVQSSSNYFLAVFPGMVIAAALCADAWLKAAAAPKPAAAAALPKAVLAIFAAIGLQLWLQLPFEATVTPPGKDALAEALYARAFLTEVDEPVYAEHFWGSVAGRPGTDLYFAETTHTANLPPGRFSEEQLAAPFKQRKFARVMLFADKVGNSFHSRALLETVLQNYQVVREGSLKVCFGDAERVPVIFLERKTGNAGNE